MRVVVPRAAAHGAATQERELRWPMVVFPRSPAARSADWGAALRGCAERYLPRLGSVLFRGFEVLDAPAFRRWVAAFGAPQLEPWGSSCLAPVACGTAGASDLPGAGAVGSLHHAYSHTARWPARLWLQCPPAQGPDALQLVDGRDVWQCLPEQARQRFAERGLAYEYDLEIEASASESQRAELGARLHAHGLSCRVNRLGGLTARQVGPVVLAHPAIGELSWFNQAHLFSSPSGEASPGVLRWCDAAGRRWSAAVRHADGSRIEPSLLAAAHEAFEQSRLVVPWEPGDVLLLDNELMAHGWHAASAQRAPTVAMADSRTFAGPGLYGAPEGRPSLQVGS